jgi:hypothetical protein
MAALTSLVTCYKGSDYVPFEIMADPTARVANTVYLVGGKPCVALRDSAAGENSSLASGGQWQFKHEIVGVDAGGDVTLADVGLTGTTVIGFATDTDGANYTTVRLWG